MSNSGLHAEGAQRDIILDPASISFSKICSVIIFSCSDGISVGHVSMTMYVAAIMHRICLCNLVGLSSPSELHRVRLPMRLKWSKGHH